MSAKKKNFKYCIVPECSNTSTNAPGKIFICLPSDQELRRTWQRAMGRSYFVSDKGTRFCCEDHFNIEEDIENFLYIKTMHCGRIRLKPGVVPHIFDCQKKGSTSDTSKPRLLTQKRKKGVIQELLLENSANEEVHLEVNRKEEIRIQKFTSTERGVQVNLKPLRRSKGIQCQSSEITCKKRKSKNTK